MPSISFNGATKVITIGYDGPLTTVTAADIYSRWKDWVAAGNAQFEQAFSESVGGNELGGGVSLSGYYFIRNDIGWRIKPSENDYELTVSGDLYPADANTAFIIPPTGDFTVLISFQRSAASYVTASGGGGGSIDYNQVAQAVWNRDMSSHTTPNTFGKRIRDLLPTLWGLK
jgi:hypothetical protein